MENACTPNQRAACREALVTQWGVALITVLILIFVALWLASGGTEQAGIDSIGGEVTGPARNFAGQMAAAGRSRGATGRGRAGRRRSEPYRRSNARRRGKSQRARSEAGR